MNHYTDPEFWEHYNALPEQIRKLADKQFELLQDNLSHPSLNLKKIKKFWSARVTRDYRALAYERNEGLVWFWIGQHAEYDTLL